jgi:hypothetical protein
VKYGHEGLQIAGSGAGLVDRWPGSGSDLTTCRGCSRPRWTHAGRRCEDAVAHDRRAARGPGRTTFGESCPAMSTTPSPAGSAAA